jgi:hypothetical protein
MMKSHFCPCASLVLLVWLVLLPALRAEESKADSALFEKTKLVYEDDFDGELNLDFWEIRQNSTWKIEDGILKGSQSSKAFQAKKIAAGDKAHAGFKPVIWLKQVPENFVCELRVRYSAEKPHAKFPLFDVGHHIHTFHLGEKMTSLTILKDKAKMKVEAPLMPLNEWADVTIALKKGVIHFSVNGKKHVFESEYIDMTGHSQIDFKGIDLGTCDIDHIKIWAGQ